MAKKENAISFKGILDVNLDERTVTITEVDKKGGESTYDVIQELSEFDGQEVSFRTADSKSLTPIITSESVSVEG